MGFSSIWYWLFLIVACFFCHKINSANRRIVFLLILSLVFFSLDSISSALCIILIVFISFFGGLVMVKDSPFRKLFFGMFLVALFIPLIIFKYSHFWLVTVFHTNECAVFFPLGISFYTFTSASYLIDAYKKEVNVEKNLLYYSFFVSMFAYHGGPIQRAKPILDQIKEGTVGLRNVHCERLGLIQILYGLFLKVFVADTIAESINPIFGNLSTATSLQALFALVMFGFQLYCDFNGYSMIAIGSANCLNLKVARNFNSPYLSVSVSDFWRRWHVSLSTWFRDYAYIPLGGNRCSKVRQMINLIVTFTLSGVWHGSSWNFVLWGFMNGAYLCVEKQLRLNKVDKVGFKKFIGRIYTFALITISWAFFRANSVSDAFIAVNKATFGLFREGLGLISGSVSVKSAFPASVTLLYNLSLICIGLLLVISSDVIRYKRNNIDGFECCLIEGKPIRRYVFLIATLVLLMVFGSWTTSSNFIYSNF